MRKDGRLLEWKMLFVKQRRERAEITFLYTVE